MLSLNMIQEAQAHIAPYVIRTPMVRIPALDGPLGCQVYLKLENMQTTSAFKLRGATNRLLTFTPEELKKGIVCLSSGNHAQGVACAAHRLGLDAVIVMPTNVNPAKLAGTKRFNVRVDLVGTEDHERQAYADNLVATEGRMMVHPYADDYVKAGQGTIGLEILEDEPEMDMIVTSVSGGGLITGVATAAKALRPQIRVIGVEPASVPRYLESRKAHKAIDLQPGAKSIADATLLPQSDPGNHEIIENLVEDLIPVGDEPIMKAMSLALRYGKTLIEPSGAMGMAVAYEGRLPAGKDDKVCFVVSGGNIDMNQYLKIIEENPM